MKKSMKTGIIVVLLLLLNVAIGAAQTFYVSEDFEITLRTGPGTDRKILSMVPSGRTLELIKRGTDWSEVRLPNGKEGWVLTRYLTEEPPSAIKLARLEKKHAEFINQNKDVHQTISDLTQKNSTLTQELKQTQETLTQVEASYATLKKDAADTIKLRTDYENNRKALDEITQKADQYESQLNRITNSQLYEGMLYGGGLIIFGFVAGFIMKRPRRRSPLM